MSPSSKFVQARGRHRTPRVCHTPPLPLIPPIPPPPLCPPAAIGGWIDAEWGEPWMPTAYYSPYTANPDPEGPCTFRDNSYPPHPSHDLVITLQAGGPHLDIELTIYSAGGEPRYYSKADIPFTWCTHNSLTVSSWDETPFDHISCVITLNW